MKPVIGMKNLYVLFGFIALCISTCMYGELANDSYGSQQICGSQEGISEEQLYFIAEAPQSMIGLWENGHLYFTKKDDVRPHDDKFFSKWRQLQKLWGSNKNESGHFERKESVVISSGDTDLEELKNCREDMQKFAIAHFKTVERNLNLPEHSLTMETAVNPTHTLRLLHYLPKATATAHCDTSIMTCLYYRDSGLQLKVNGEWIDAPKLKPNEMLVSYGVPGEILTDGNLKAVRHRVRCDERYAVAYFHNTPKNFCFPENTNYRGTDMAHVYQEAQLWYANVNARAVRNLCGSTEIPWYVVLYGWAAQLWSYVDETPISKKTQ